jgi:solute carrier family 34 (sodium-dependent phosphate cotransporter)
VTESNPIEAKRQVWYSVRMTLYVLGALLLFLFAIDLMISSLQHLSRGAIETIIVATANPFTGLFIGLLITAMIQSSSTTTALVVALVASGSLTLESAVPIIMGANIGTTITSAIVSLSFINKRKEFRRAVAAGTYHSFFNILTVIILFPLEYYYGILSGMSSHLTSYFFTPSEINGSALNTHFWISFDPIVNGLLRIIPSGFFLAFLSFVLLFGSILVFRKLISDWLLVKSPERFGRFFFRSPLKSFAWGMLTTAAIRSSTITTSLVVPLVAKRVVRISQAAPFIMGANVGTTITAFIAATVYANTYSAITIATAHFLFNFIGVLLFFPIPVLREIPIDLASYLGKLTLRYRMVGLVYLLSAFFFIPFSLIYFNRDAVETITIVYENKNEESGVVSTTKLVSRINRSTRSGEWVEYIGDSSMEVPSKIYPIYFKDNVLFLKGGLIMFNKPGFCWDGENEKGKYSICIESTLNAYEVLPNVSIDSVYVCRMHFYNDPPSKNTRLYVSPTLPVILHQVTIDSIRTVETQRVLTLSRD